MGILVAGRNEQKTKQTKTTKTYTEISFIEWYRLWNVIDWKILLKNFGCHIPSEKTTILKPTKDR